MNARPRFLVLLAAWICLPAWAAQSTGMIARASDLQHDGRLAGHKGVPVLIVFTRPDCRYCDRVIDYYLVPMQANPSTAGTVLIRQLDMTSPGRLVDFSGRVTTAQAFARMHKVDFAPTVMLFTPAGKPAGRPLVGLGPEDYYGGYLDQAVEAAREKIRGTTPGTSPGR